MVKSAGATSASASSSSISHSTFSGEALYDPEPFSVDHQDDDAELDSNSTDPDPNLASNDDDLSVESISALRDLCLAQAQEIAWQKAVLGECLDRGTGLESSSAGQRRGVLSLDHSLDHSMIPASIGLPTRTRWTWPADLTISQCYLQPSNLSRFISLSAHSFPSLMPYSILKPIHLPSPALVRLQVG